MGQQTFKITRDDVEIELEVYYQVLRAEPDVGIMNDYAEITRVEAFDNTTGRWFSFDDELSDKDMFILTELLNDGDF